MLPVVEDKNVDISVYREDFPALHQRVSDRSLTYLDTASSAQKPYLVLDTIREAYDSSYANIHRGLYHNSQVTTEAFEAVRVKAAKLLNAPSEKEVIFTRNTTEAINLAAQSYGRTFLSESDEIILSEMEHHANIVPWQMLQEQIGVQIKVIPVLDDGSLDFDAFEKLLSSKTRFLSLVHISNALGTINDVKKFTKAAKSYNPDIKVLIDGSQSVVHGSVDVQALGCDFFVFTGHKLYGPTGAGVLWGRHDVLERMPPYQGGGDMIETVGFDGTTFKEPPARFEAGTPSFVDVIGLGVAIDYVQAIGMRNIADHEASLLTYAEEALGRISGVTFFGISRPKAGIISFTADWAHPSDIAMILDKCGVAVRTGHHCCMPLMQRFGVDGTVRVSFGLYSNMNDIDVLCESLEKAQEMLS